MMTWTYIRSFLYVGKTVNKRHIKGEFLTKKIFQIMFDSINTNYMIYNFRILDFNIRAIYYLNIIFTLYSFLIFTSHQRLPTHLWNYANTDKYRDYVTISTNDSTINVDERIVYIDDLEKRKQAYGICAEYFLNEINSIIHINDIIQCYGITQDPNSKDSECLDLQLSELELNEICQDSEHNIE
ncbi:unnamed protein product [Rhizophagus irregularis]|nr:unnamed protein product [Rhizophagus irregularis]